MAEEEAEKHINNANGIGRARGRANFTRQDKADLSNVKDVLLGGGGEEQPLMYSRTT